MANRYATISDKDRFWSHVDRSGGSGACWPWRSSTTDGYGRFSRGGRGVLAHRYAFELANGPFPSDLHVLHRCDNPPCVNDAHLFLGTDADNEHDKIAKGRYRNGNERKTHCPRGHEYTEENTRRGDTSRYCRACESKAGKALRATLKEMNRGK